MTDTFSISMWIKFNSLDASDQIFHVPANPPLVNGCQAYINSGFLVFVCNATIQIPVSNITQGQWHHLVFIQNSSAAGTSIDPQVQVYIDGIDLTSSFSTLAVFVNFAGNNFILGADPTLSTTLNFDGKISNLEIFNADALDQTAVTALFEAGYYTDPMSVILASGSASAPILEHHFLFGDTLGDTLSVIQDVGDGTSLSNLVTSTPFVTFDTDIPPEAPELLITGIIDGPLSGGQPKSLELYVGQDIADMSVFSLELYFNGSTSVGSTFNFPAVAVSAGTFLYITGDATGFSNWFGFSADYVDGGINHNGNDNFVLKKNTTSIDQFGQFGVDGTGTGWEYLDGWAYRNNGTKEEVPFIEAEWSYSGPDALDGETDNATAANPFPNGTWDKND
jgi:hypothetical protein